MNDLIKALQILALYADPEDRWPTNCDHDIFRVSIDPAIVSEEHKAELEELGFYADESIPGFCSYRFGSN